MKTTFTKEEIIKLLEEYYKRLEGREVKVKVSSKRECVGLYEEDGCVTTFTVVEAMDIAGIHKEVSETLSQQELQKNLRALFGLYEIDLTSLQVDDGLTTSWEGWGLDETQVKKPYFNGVTVELKIQKGQAKAMYYR